MATTTVCVDADRTKVSRDLVQAIEALNPDQRELVLDFSRVSVIDAAAVRAMERLANSDSLKVVVRNINTGVYKTLKLANLASRFTFEHS
jgi:anti-anti-sigma regulatory factor